MNDNTIKIWIVTYLDDKNKKKKELRISGDNVLSVIKNVNEIGVNTDDVLTIEFYQFKTSKDNK